MVRLWLPALLLALAATGCTRTTSIVLIIDGDLRPGIDVDLLWLRVRANGEEVSFTPYDLLASDPLPQSLAIHAGDRVRGEVSLGVVAMALSMFIWGDAVAALVGQSIGRTRIGKKSLEGSIGCFVLCLCVCFLLYPHVPLLLDAWAGRIPLPIVLVAAFTTTVFELVPFRMGKSLIVNDNLVVPVITGLVMVWLYPVF